MPTLSTETAAKPSAPPAYRPHLLHASDRVWPETNCYVDLWVELLNLRGLVPEAMLGFTLRQDFEGDQFTFFKPGMADIEMLYGLRLEELAIHENLERQSVTQTRLGRIVLAEVDAIHLPDTAGTTYGVEHSKTTIGIIAIDPAARRLDYLHNAGRFLLEGADYDGVFAASLLPPYAEFVKEIATPLGRDRLPVAAFELLRGHLAAAPRRNPVEAFQAALVADAATLVLQPLSVFHRYAFHTTRQFGANFELLGSHLSWLASTGMADLGEAARIATTLGQEAKTFQFHLARAFNKRSGEGLAGRLDGTIARYDDLFASLRRVLA